MIVVALLALGAALTWVLPEMPGIRGIAGYLPLHMLLETFAIVVAILVFAVGWNAHSDRLPGSMVLLSCAFLGVGLLDFAHMLSFAGMPEFVTPSGPEKAINFWLLERSLATIALLAAVIMPQRPFVSATPRYLLLAAAIAITALAYWLFLFHQDAMPHTFIPGQGLTVFKIGSEYAIVALNLAAAFVLWARRRKPQPFNVAALFGAACTMALGEFFFTLYASVSDIYNLLGHAYVVISYLFFYRAIFVAAIESPYRQLSASQNQLRATIDAIPDTLFELGLDGRYLDFHTIRRDLLAVSVENLLEKTVADVLPPDAAGVAMSALQEALENGQSYGKVVELPLAQGKRWFELSVSRKRTGEGQEPRFIVLSRDITKRKNDEAQIERLSRIYRLLSRVNEAIVRAWNKNLLFDEICNAAMESELFRFVWIGMLDKNESLVIPTASSGIEDGYMYEFNIRLDDMSCREWPIVTAIREGVHVVRQEIESVPSFAPWRIEALKRGYRSIGIFPIREGGVVAGTINVYAAEEHFFTQDIIKVMLELSADMSFALDVFAERKRRESAEDEIRRINVDLEHRVSERTRQLEAANKELEAFSYSVSHDLRAPLRSIDGFSRVLSQNYHAQLDATGKDWLERVCRASQRMGNLIDDMLQLSQVARSPLRREAVDLSNIAGNVADELRKNHPEREVRFILQNGLMLYADPGLLRVVMDNLLGNAWKYTGKKSEAEIEFGACEINGSITYFVRDNGTGFDMNYAHKLFGPFQRLHGLDEFEGTGIGLATVQRIIHRHYGKVWAEAIEGQGATFYVTIPQKSQET